MAEGDKGDEAEDSIRDYLTWLDDPSKLVDEQAIGAAQSRLDEAIDPIDRLRLIGELERLEQPDTVRLESQFIDQAKHWAAQNDVGGEAFVRLGVPHDVLRRAGFELGPSGRSGSSARRVSAADVRSAVPSGPFSIADLVARSGASIATVRKVVNELVEEGVVVDLGPDQAFTGRGRAPYHYRLV